MTNAAQRLLSQAAPKSRGAGAGLFQHCDPQDLRPREDRIRSSPFSVRLMPDSRARPTIRWLRADERTGARHARLYLAQRCSRHDDGERVTIVEFADEESQRGWAQHPEHRAEGSRDGANSSEYWLQVCGGVRQSEKKPG